MNTRVKNKYIMLHYIKIILKWAADQLNHSDDLQEKIHRHAEKLMNYINTVKNHATRNIMSRNIMSRRIPSRVQ